MAALFVAFEGFAYVDRTVSAFERPWGGSGFVGRIPLPPIIQPGTRLQVVDVTGDTVVLEEVP